MWVRAPPEEKTLLLLLTPKRPVIHTCFTYPILNMGDFSALYGPLGCIDSTQKVKGNSLHAEEGIGKGKGSGIIHICFKMLKKYSGIYLAFVV